MANEPDRRTPPDIAGSMQNMDLLQRLAATGNEQSQREFQTLITGYVLRTKQTLTNPRVASVLSPTDALGYRHVRVMDASKERKLAESPWAGNLEIIEVDGVLKVGFVFLANYKDLGIVYRFERRRNGVVDQEMDLCYGRADQHEELGSANPEGERVIEKMPPKRYTNLHPVDPNYDNATDTYTRIGRILIPTDERRLGEALLQKLGEPYREIIYGTVGEVTYIDIDQSDPFLPPDVIRQSYARLQPQPYTFQFLTHRVWFKELSPQDFARLPEMFPVFVEAVDRLVIQATEILDPQRAALVKLVHQRISTAEEAARAGTLNGRQAESIAQGIASNVIFISPVLQGAVQGGVSEQQVRELVAIAVEERLAGFQTTVNERLSSLESDEAQRDIQQIAGNDRKAQEQLRQAVRGFRDPERVLHAALHIARGFIPGAEGVVAVIEAINDLFGPPEK